MTALGDIIDHPQVIIMWLVGLGFLYLGIKKKYEPLLLVPIGFGMILANALGGGMGVVQSDDVIMHMNLIEIEKEHGIMNFLY